MPFGNSPFAAFAAISSHMSSGCFAVPAGGRAAKIWPPVRRIDAAHGDRHLVCSCPPLEELAE